MNFAEKIKYFFKKYKISLLVALFYTATAFFVCFFLLKDIAHALIPGDGLFTYWTMGWDVHSFLHNPGNLFNANIFYPNPNTLAYSEGLFAPALIALPFFLILRNMIVVYNLMIFFSYILAAFGAYKLAKYYTKNNYASFIAGLIFGFATFRVANGHFQNLIIFWMPFAVLYLQKYLDTKKRKYIVYFALLFSAQMLTSWYMGAFLSLFIAFLLITNWRLIRDNFSSFIRDGLIALVLIAILVAPFAYPYFKLHRETNFAYPVWEIISGSSDIGGYIFPIPGSLESPIMSLLKITKVHWSENVNFLGYFSLLLLIYYFFFSKNKIKNKNFKIFFWGIPIFMIFSFGPVLRSFSFMTIPLPYQLLVPFLGFVRSPNRLAIIVLLCLSIAVAYIIASIKLKNIKLKFVLAVLAPIIILLEFYVPRGPLPQNTACPEVYSYIKNSNSVSAIVEMPIQENADGALPYIYYSTCDDFKPIFNGYSGYFPAKYTNYSTKLRQFPADKSLDLMKQIGISHVLLHFGTFPENQTGPSIEDIRRNSRLKIEYEDGKDFLISVH
ncbi:MAG: hypothetical protein NT170_01945 [Candidatus Moranbacteria bacterium]|nr:hypothetical protein [Candidatus Moranbacteria bacterium]